LARHLQLPLAHFRLSPGIEIFSMWHGLIEPDADVEG
jgi:hypothetical protein